MNRGEFKIQETGLVVLSIFVVVSLFSFIGMSVFYKDEVNVSASSEGSEFIAEEENINIENEELNEEQEATDAKDDNPESDQKPKEQPEKIAFCEEGFRLSDSRCEKEETTDRIAKRICPEDFFMEGEKCISRNGVPAEKVCPEGTTYSELINRCSAKELEGDIEEEKEEAFSGDKEGRDSVPVELKCGVGLILDNESCKQQTSILVEYSCLDGFILEGEVCKRTISTDIQYR